MQKYDLYPINVVVLECFEITAMQSSQQFSKFQPSVFTAIGLGEEIYMMTLNLKYIPLRIVYTFWSGLGIVFITAISVFDHKQLIDVWAILGLVLVILGIIIIHLFLTTSTLA